MDQTIQDFIQAKNVAVVGVSRSGKKFGNIAYTELKQRGYQVFAVHPEAKEIGGEPCYPNLASLKGRVDSVLISVPSRQAAQALREAAGIGVKQIWLQQGAQSSETAAVARELGLNPITGKCILMYAQPVRGLHTWHRAFNKLVGQL